MRVLLIQKRKRKKLTQQQIADMLEISRSTYSAYETGQIDPPLKIATKIKEILSYKNDDIFLNENVSKTDKLISEEV